MHSTPLGVDLEHGACTQKLEHGGQSGDTHRGLRVQHHDSEGCYHTSRLERRDLQPQLPHPVQLRNCWREGVLNLAGKKPQALEQGIGDAFPGVGLPSSWRPPNWVPQKLAIGDPVCV